MAIFRRKPKNTSGLPEVEQYYSAERHERSGLAWLLAIVSIIIVALIIVGLFFGGRWLYRTITEDDSQPEVTTSDTGSSTTVDGGPSDNKDSGSTGSSSTDSGSSTSSNGSNSSGSSSGSTGSTGSSSGSSSSTGSSGSTGSTSGTSSSSTGSQTTAPAADSSNLPNTGPGDTVAIFFGATALATAGHYLYQKRKAARW